MSDDTERNQDYPSYTLRSGDSMNAIAQSLADEMQGIVFGAAQPVRPGDTVKAQMRRAWTELARPPFWRLRAAWYGEAGFWRGYSHEDMRRRHAERLRKEASNADANRDRTLTVLGTLRTAYAVADPDLYREQILALEHELRRAGVELPPLGTGTRTKAEGVAPASPRDGGQT